MKIITRIKSQLLNSETHVSLHEGLRKIYLKYDLQLLGIILLYKLYSSAFDEELTALDFIRKSKFTKLISEQDRVRDKIYRGLTNSIKAATNHFDIQYREVALRLQDIFEHYGNIANKTLDEKTSAIDDLRRELQLPSLANAVSFLGLDVWLTKLGEENTKFEQLMMQRYTETAEKPSFRMKSSRVIVDKYHVAIVHQLENLALTGNTEVENIVKEMNAIIERFKHILAQERGAANN
jgi:hypothetical protein